MLLHSNRETFQNHFKNKLAEMLKPDELGTFILVLANSMQESQLRQSLSSDLNVIFNQLKSNTRLSLEASADDLTVFNALKISGISDFSSWQKRQLGHWQCALNSLRALRPDRASKEVFTGLSRPFDNDAFHFAKAFLHAEIISEEVFQNMNLQLMYHKFPFAPFHSLIVIDAHQQRPQVLDKTIHEMIDNLARHLEQNIAGFGLAYNSLGAGASVNHLHIHGFVDNTLYAVENQQWKHNGGPQDYPLDVSRFSSAQQSWQLIEQCHQHNRPYNLLYRSGFCYVIQRKPQGTAELPEWLSSIGWHEACGGFNLSIEKHFKSLKTGDIEAVLAHYCP